MSDNTKQTIKVIEITKEGLEELNQELSILVDQKLPKVIERVSNAREQGDLSENADYQSARDEQDFLETRISEIKENILRAKVVQNTKSHTIVGMGSTVVVIIKGKASKKFTYHIVGEFESDPGEGKISSQSPLGSALMGKKKGDEIKVQAPVGEIVYIIKEIK